MMRRFCSREHILVAALLAVTPLLLAQEGCPILGPGTSALSLAVSGPAANQSVAAGSPVSLIYSAAGSGSLDIRAFYDRDGAPGSGDETYFATGLPAGTNVTALWNTVGVAAGLYHLGVWASDGLTAQTAYAVGTVTVQQPFSITFAAPVPRSCCVSVHPCRVSSRITRFTIWMADPVPATRRRSPPLPATVPASPRLPGTPRTSPLVLISSASP